MSVLLSKDSLYRDQEYQSKAANHSILASAQTSTGTLAISYPHHVLAIPVPNATGDIDVAINGAQFQVLDAWVVKNTSAAAAGDDVVIKHVAQDGTTVTSIGLFTTLTFATAMGAASRRQSVPNLLQSQPVFADRCKLRISATSATNCGCTVYLAIGLA